jgi:hypothetical protein
MKDMSDVVDAFARYILSTMYWAAVLGICIAAFITWHNYDHAIDKYTNDIESDRRYVESFCYNDTLVRLTKRYEECEKARSVASMNPRWEAVVKTVERMHLCAREHDPHSVSLGPGGHSHDHDESGSSHCDHAYYVLFGLAISSIIFLVVLRRCVVRVNS